MKKILVCFFVICFVISTAVWGRFMGETAELTGAEASADKKLPVIVIDAGHGGMDGGASAADGTQEKDINLAIAKALAKKMQAYPLKVIMTREKDEALCGEEGQTIRQKKREDLLRRKEIMEGEDVELSISIHLNSFPQDEKVYGPQVFYPQPQGAGTNVLNGRKGAKDYAEAIQKSLEINIDDGRKRKAMTKGDILLFKNTAATMVLVECGFLSNPQEAEKLKTAEYQQVLADGIWQGVNEILCLDLCKNMEIIDSTNKVR